MLIREPLIKRIEYLLTHLSCSAKLLGKMHFFDQNIAAEHFYQELLNQVYGHNLANLNHTKINTAAIDLADISTGLAVQVTSQRNALKIQKTLNTFALHGLGTTYTSLKVVIIGSRTGAYKTVSVPSSVTFDRVADVIDDSSLLRDIGNKSTAELEEILAMMEREIRCDVSVKTALDQTDDLALSKLREAMDRPALQDSWSTEHSYKDFGEALTALIGIINTGKLDGQLKTKPRFAYTNPRIAEQLDVLYQQLRALRQLFQAHVRSGEIDLARNICHFNLPQTDVTFDALRNNINAGFDSITKPYGIPPLPKIR